MNPRNTLRAISRSAEASRREVLFSFASVILVSALIGAMTLSVVRMPL
ncbi:hypothetical protein [Azonexus sp. IMCC34839]